MFDSRCSEKKPLKVLSPTTYDILEIYNLFLTWNHHFPHGTHIFLIIFMALKEFCIAITFF
jgi:hypothetical protein